MMDAKYKAFVRNISWFIPDDRIYTDDLRCLAWGTDASFYRHVPKVVVRSRNEQEVSRLLQEASKLGLPVTFRAAGTSLSGQTNTDSILIVAGKNWENYELSDDASTITMQPGLVGHKVDEILKPYGRVFSPDPASKNSAMVGGIVINNASGMSCGTHANSDKVLKSMRIVMADGTVLDTGDAGSRAAFKAKRPDFVKGIEKLRDKIMADPELVKRIKYKYQIKNVTGLNLLPFVRFTDPFDIITHCMVGSEGTLGFASQFTMSTGHLYSHSASAMLYFDDMRKASECIVELKNSPVECAEMLDKKSLSAAEDKTGEGLTAILVRTSADDQDTLDKNIAQIMDVVGHYKLHVPARFTSDPAEYGKYWQIRSGIFPIVAGTRPIGTTVIIEDIAFHIQDLPDATVDLARMLNEHGYADSCIYGHALEGNFHFVISQSFETDEDVKRYEELMRETVKLVVDKYDGSLKAEHGTGRNMAPFVRKEWGDKAYGIMKEIKQLFDPQNILNPGVIFNEDPESFVQHIKPLPRVNEHVDKCMECGFCEVNCLSCGFTLSSRQRIVTQREIARLRATGEDPARLKRMTALYKYYGDYTCAADGLCSTSCPMKINTGDMTHDLARHPSPQGLCRLQDGRLLCPSPEWRARGHQAGPRPGQCCPCRDWRQGRDGTGPRAQCHGRPAVDPVAAQGSSPEAPRHCRVGQEGGVLPQLLESDYGSRQQGPEARPGRRGGSLPQEMWLGGDISRRHEATVLRHDMGEQGHARYCTAQDGRARERLACCQRQRQVSCGVRPESLPAPHVATHDQSETA
jgi:D-lactate dehydrogenase